MRPSLLKLTVLGLLGAGLFFALPRLSCWFGSESFTITVRDARGRPASGAFYKVVRRVTPGDGFLGGPPSTVQLHLQSGRVPSDGVIHLPSSDDRVWWVVNDRVPFEGRRSWPCARGHREITLSDADAYTLSVRVDGVPASLENRVTLQLAEKARPGVLPRKLGSQDVFEVRDFWFYGKGTDDAGCVSFHGLDFVDDLEAIDLAWEGGYELAPGTRSPFPIQRGETFGELSLVSPLSLVGQLVDSMGQSLEGCTLQLSVSLAGERTDAEYLLEETSRFEIPIRHRELTLARFGDGQSLVDGLVDEIEITAVGPQGEARATRRLQTLDVAQGARLGDLVLRAE